MNSAATREGLGSLRTALTTVLDKEHVANAAEEGSLTAPLAKCLMRKHEDLNPVLRAHTEREEPDTGSCDCHLAMEVNIHCHLVKPSQ